jgi:hypothetical protein
VSGKEIGGGARPIGGALVGQWGGARVVRRDGGRRWWSWHGGHRRRGPSSAPQGGERGEVGSRMTENGRGWRLTERVNDGGDAVEICRVVALRGWGGWEDDGGLPAGSSK